MQSTFTRIAAFFILLTASFSVFASNSGGSSWYSYFVSRWNYYWTNFWNTWGSSGGSSAGSSGGNSVPELDGATGPLAVALITVVVGIGLERNRRNKQRMADAA